MKDFKVDINDQEVLTIFGVFDRDGSGEIDYDEFVRGVRGPMN
jgi:Ca2+-binding EF-hand superfamily protein